jgi:hypothetical protein
MITKSTVDEAHALSRQLYRDGTLPKDKYFKCLVAYAYEYAQIDSREDVRALLAECDSAYFSKTLPTQMADDLDFHEIAYFVAVWLDESSSDMGEGESFLLSMAKTGKA